MFDLSNRMLIPHSSLYHYARILMLNTLLSPSPSNAALLTNQRAARTLQNPRFKSNFLNISISTNPSIRNPLTNPSTVLQ